MPNRAVSTKSLATNEQVIAYCHEVSLKQDPLLVTIIYETLRNAKHGFMIGAPEVHQLGQYMIRLIQAKKALDVGTFTGASAVAWALALPSDGEILTMDVSDDDLRNLTKELIQSRKDVASKINFTIGNAVDTLDSLLNAGQAGKWDFAFIDADKENYPIYYEKCVELLRPGGVIIIDNALLGGRVVAENKDESAAMIDKTNRRAFEDERVDSILLPIADGINLIFKKYKV